MVKASPTTQSDAIKVLAAGDDIVVKPTDKGGAIAVWPVEKYISEANRLVGDTGTARNFGRSQQSIMKILSPALSAVFAARSSSQVMTSTS